MYHEISNSCAQYGAADVCRKVGPVAATIIGGIFLQQFHASAESDGPCATSPYGRCQPELFLASQGVFKPNTATPSCIHAYMDYFVEIRYFLESCAGWFEQREIGDGGSDGPRHGMHFGVV